MRTNSNILRSCGALLLVAACGVAGGADSDSASSGSGGLTTAGDTDSATGTASDTSDPTMGSQSGTSGSSGEVTGDDATATLSGSSGGDTDDGTTTGGEEEGSSSTGEEACAAVSAEAELVPLPADIIFVVDNSGSMSFEAGEIQDRMNDFSSQIIDSGIDAHVVLISSYPNNGNGICIDTPLGSGGCPNDDTNLPTFLHVDERVGSHDAWQRLVGTHDQWADSMREESSKHVVIVSDDDPNWTDDQFNTAFLALDPSYEGYFHDSVVTHSNCPSSAGIGQDYIDLSIATGGVAADLCDQDFQAVFDALTTAVLGGAALSCDFAIPDPPEGEVLDPDAVNVDIGSAMAPLDTIPRVDDLMGCDAVMDGWYYDNPDDPTQIYLCPQTCESLQAIKDGVINIGFGCETILPG